MNVSEAIRSKRAVRQFTEQPLTDAEIERILNAGRLAQSSKNTQPWQFIVIRDRALLEQVATTGDFLTHVRGAAVCVVLAMPVDERPLWRMFDLGQAASYMQLAAHELGIGSVLGAIYRTAELHQILGLPDGMTAYALISFGYEHPEHVGRNLGKDGRKSLEDITHWERW